MALYLNKIEYFISDFEAFLKEKGPWFAWINFPLEHPKQFLENISLSSGRNHYIKNIKNGNKRGSINSAIVVTRIENP
jgi:hypothetical protein